eukprot:scaffold31846_cov19-Tisochrysis_lutea.AAC.1
MHLESSDMFALKFGSPLNALPRWSCTSDLNQYAGGEDFKSRAGTRDCISNTDGKGMGRVHQT